MTIEKKQVNQYSPAALAFLGDAVYEELVRERLVSQANCPARKLHNAAVERVRAGYQAKAAELIADKLSDDEAAVMKRGRNAGVSHACIPKSSNPVEYHKATGLEVLFGYLKLSGDQARINELFDIIWSISEEGGS